MFCPKCGNANQSPETYCRKCGFFLNDFDKQLKKTITPQEHLTANTVLSLMTAVCSLTLAILLIIFVWKKPDVSPIVYVTTGFLFAMCAWQIQTFWRNILLKKQLKRPANNHLAEADNNVSEFPQTVDTNKLLAEAEMRNSIPVSVIENTTRKLNKNLR